jgi:predicted RNase H-like nuclease (RuvC/YqgF family)
MWNNPVAEAMEEMHQTLSEEVLEKLMEIFAWLEKDAQDQFKDLDHFEEMLESISQELPEDINASLASICGLEIHYVPIRQALRKVRSRPAIEKKRASAEQAMNGAQSQTESHKDTLANMQASCDLKNARKAALEAELRSLSAEIEADNRKIAEFPQLTEKTQEEAKSDMAKMKQCDAELTTLSSAQKDCQDRLDNFR